MELEFDKEIDAILRKARPNKGVLVGDEPPDPPEQKKHVDADVVAAFVENALPDKTKQLYMEHFADCDKCRKQLSLAMQMHAANVSEESTAPTVSAAVETVVPWYQKIFRAPNLALTMGALVLVFGGLLGFLVLKQKNDTSSTTVSEITEPEDRRGGPYAGAQDGPALSAASNANASANMAPGSNMTVASNSMKSAAANSLANARQDAAGVKLAEGVEDAPFQSDGVSAGAPAPPPKSAPATKPASDSSASGALLDTTSDKKAYSQTRKEEAKDADDLAKRKQSEDRGRGRDMPPPAAKVGPARGGALLNQNQNQIQSLPSNGRNLSEMSVTRVVGGKTFSNRNGAWYDSAYHNEPTTNIRRGTPEYKKLDKGLRSIADSVGGTVVIIWKAKAYRIQ